MATTLPSSQELQDAGKNGDTDRCQELVLQAIIYGIGQHEAHKERTLASCTVLADAWEDCLALENALVDALWLTGSMIMTSSEEEGGHAKKQSVDALVEIVKALVQVPDRNSFWTKLQGNLMPSLIDSSGLASSQEFLKKLKIHNTQVHYKQQKYNLLQEESEGYSKLLQYLSLDPTSRPSRNDSPHEFLRKLLGSFELDPNRVLDLTMDFLEASLYPEGSCKDDDLHKPRLTDHSLWLLTIMKELCRDKLPALIGFKMAFSSPSFLRMVTLLATEGLLELAALRNDHFGGLQGEIGEAHKVMWIKEKKKILAMSRISLTGATKVDPKQAELEQQFESLLKPLKQNLFLEVLLLTIHWGGWASSKPLFPTDTWSQLCSIMPEEFGFALCDVAQMRLQGWLRSVMPSASLASKQEEPTNNEMEGVEHGVSIDEMVAALSDSLLCVVQSACIGFRSILFCQICRLFRSLLSKTGEECSLTAETYSFFKVFLVPSMSLFPANPAISTELWSVLKRLPYATRYRLYEDWRGAGLERAGLSSSSKGKPLPNILSEMQAGKAARYALKRLSKDNIRDMSRQLAKVTHSNPLVVYATILSQIESYDNMVEVMVEAQRFVNPLGLDVLGYCILGRLSGKTGGINRSRLKDDGVNVSQWLQSLESFTGAFFKRFPYVEFRGMLCYLMRRLREGNVMELGILRTLLKVTGGYSFADYSPAASLNVTQLEGRAGSRMLKIETMSFGIVEETNQQAADRIRHVLQNAGFGVSMLIHIAQVRSRILFESTKNSPKEVKLVGNLYDSCQVVMSILLDFLLDCDGQKETLDANVDGSILKYAGSLPTLDELQTKYGVDAVSTWMLCRPLVRSANRISSSGDESSVSTSHEKLKRFAFSSSFRKAYEAMLPENVWSILSCELYEYFCTHDVYDIFLPESTYEGELNRLKKEIERLQQRQKGGPSGALHAGSGSQKDDVEVMNRLKLVSSGLASDLSKQKEHVSSVQKTMGEKKDSFFGEKGTLRELARIFFVYCILPRSTQSPDDAMYCARFSFRLHQLDCARFSTLHYIDELISVVAGSLFGVTEGEAAHLAILLWETWKVVNKWRYEDGLYDLEVAGKPGSFITSSVVEGDDDAGEHEVSHDEFSSFYNRWHASLGSALVGCLKSSEYMHSRAGLVVLTRIVEVFPTRPKLGNKLLQVLAPLQDESSSRPDIRASANAYGTMLLKARDEGKWVEEDAAVAKARADKEKLAAEARKKKIAEQFQELERDSEKITDKIGPRDNIRDRHDRRRERDYGSGRAPPADLDRPRNQTGLSASENGKARLSVAGRMESGEVPSGHDKDDRRGGNARRPSPAREGGRGRDSEQSAGRPHDRQHASDNWRRDGPDTNRGSRDEAPRGLAGRWSNPVETRAGDSRGRTSKRSRPPSPEPPADGRGNDWVGAKRPRLAQDNENPFESRTDGRGASPTRRPRSPLSSTRPRSRRNRR